MLVKIKCSKSFLLSKSRLLNRIQRYAEAKPASTDLTWLYFFLYI